METISQTMSFEIFFRTEKLFWFPTVSMFSFFLRISMHKGKKFSSHFGTWFALLQHTQCRKSLEIFLFIWFFVSTKGFPAFKWKRVSYWKWKVFGISLERWWLQANHGHCFALNVGGVGEVRRNIVCDLFNEIWMIFFCGIVEYETVCFSLLLLGCLNVAW